jgi:hypothetical protein
VRLFFVTVLAVWAAACLGLRLRLHRRVLVAGVQLPVVDQALKELGGPWMRRVAFLSVLVIELWSPGAIKLAAKGIGLREVMALVAAGVFRLCSGATMWSELRAVEDHQIHRVDIHISLVWELVFWTHIGLNALLF